MVWGDIENDSQSPLVLIHGTIIDPRNVSEILQPHVLSLLSGLSGAIFNRTMLPHIQERLHKTHDDTFPPFFDLFDSQICHRSSIYGIVEDGKLDSQRVRSIRG
ncbi:hypothetical protein TNCV_1321171 [Trichonephila clavipes]|nr:hypothetical protein TNCV_1321171 [Trichonephila clavipes]